MVRVSPSSTSSLSMLSCSVGATSLSVTAMLAESVSLAVEYPVPELTVTVRLLSGMSRRSSFVDSETVVVLELTSNVASVGRTGSGRQWLPRRNEPGSVTDMFTTTAFVVGPVRVRVKVAVSPSVTVVWSAAMVTTRATSVIGTDA